MATFEDVCPVCQQDKEIDCVCECKPHYGIDSTQYRYNPGSTIPKPLFPSLSALIPAKESNPKDIIGSDKVPLSLVPGSAKTLMALGLCEGMLKYGLVNWRAVGVRASIYLDACERHMEKYKNGEWEDPVTHVPHLGSAMACLAILADAHCAGKLIDDRPKSAPVGDSIDHYSSVVKHLRDLFKDHRPHHYTQADEKENA